MRTIKGIALVALLAVFSIPAIASAQNAPAGANSAQAQPQATGSPAVTTLMQAAQRLRDATHDLVRESDPQKRNQIIRQIDKTLFEVQAAIVDLPPNLLLAGVRESESKKAAGEMAKAADQLNAAAAKLSKAGSAKTSNSIKDIQKALAEIQKERTRIKATGADAHAAAQ